MSLYALGVTGRFGLGHGMLAWARSVVWAEQNSAKVIAPNWLQVRVGPILRNERDKRFYFKLFRAGEQIGGLQKLSLMMRAQRVSIEDWTGESHQSTGGRPVVVEFRNAVGDNEKKHFHEVIGHHALIRAALLDMTKPKYRPARALHAHVAVHIRGGDFATPTSTDQLTAGRQNLRIPVSWYAAVIPSLRKRLGDDVAVVVYSDCTDQEIADVLALPNTVRSTYRESVTDMLAMADAAVLISSGSGFSRWGSFLGQVPRICYLGQRGIRVLGNRVDGVDYEPELLSADTLEPGFMAKVERRLTIGQATRTDGHR